MLIQNVELENTCRLGLKNCVWGLKNLDINYSFVAPGETLSFHGYKN